MTVKELIALLTEMSATIPSSADAEIGIIYKDDSGDMRRHAIEDLIYENSGLSGIKVYIADTAAIVNYDEDYEHGFKVTHAPKT